LWKAGIETKARDDLSLEADSAWPRALSVPPDYALYENPDTDTFVCEVFLMTEPSPDDIALIKKTLKDFLGLSDLALDFAEIQEEDWIRVSLDHLTPVFAGRFFVHGSHDKDKVPGGKVPLLIDASLAFGTGHHETTRGCLLALERLSAEMIPKNILDLGTGSGILAIGAHKIWPKASIMASDNDPKAVEKGTEFAGLNDASAISFLLAEGFDDKAFKGKAFDLVIANILAGPLVDLAPDIKAHLAPKGRVILAGLLAGQRNEVLAAYKNQGLKLFHEIQGQGWPVLTLG